MKEADKSEDFIIREYRESDFEGIIDLWEITNMGSPERGDNKSTIAVSINLGGCLLVMEKRSSGRICGTSWLTFDGRRLLLHHFGILPECQGKGLSKSLLKETLDVVREKGHQVKLEVHNTNHKAISLYKKFGFEHLGDYNVFIIRDISKM